MSFLLNSGALTLKVPITTAADDNFFYLFFYFPEKTSLDISCESFVWQMTKQMIHMKCQDLFSLENKKKIADDSHAMSRLFFSGKCKQKLKCLLLQILLGALRVNLVSFVLEVVSFTIGVGVMLLLKYICLALFLKPDAFEFLLGNKTVSSYLSIFKIDDLNPQIKGAPTCNVFSPLICMLAWAFLVCMTALESDGRFSSNLQVYIMGQAFWSELILMTLLSFSRSV